MIDKISLKIIDYKINHLDKFIFTPVRYNSKFEVVEYKYFEFNGQLLKDAKYDDLSNGGKNFDIYIKANYDNSLPPVIFVNFNPSKILYGDASKTITWNDFREVLNFLEDRLFDEGISTNLDGAEVVYIELQKTIEMNCYSTDYLNAFVKGGGKKDINNDYGTTVYFDFKNRRCNVIAYDKGCQQHNRESKQLRIEVRLKSKKAVNNYFDTNKLTIEKLEYNWDKLNTIYEKVLLSKVFNQENINHYNSIDKEQDLFQLINDEFDKNVLYNYLFAELLRIVETNGINYSLVEWRDTLKKFGTKKQDINYTLRKIKKILNIVHKAIDGKIKQNSQNLLLEMYYKFIAFKLVEKNGQLADPEHFNYYIHERFKQKVISLIESGAGINDIILDLRKGIFFNNSISDNVSKKLASNMYNGKLMELSNNL